jgi:integrase
LPRSRKDGTPAAPTNRRRLTEPYVKGTKPRTEPFNTWDSQVPGLVLRIQPTGHRSWRYFYCRHRACWYHIGNATSIPITEARRIAIDLAARVARGEDPAADRKAERNAGTFAELAADYVERHAKRNNKSYRQAEALVARYLLPKWGKLKATDVQRKDVRAALDRIEAPILSNQVLASASAIFSWAVEQDILAINPARGIKRHAVKARERILTETEVPLFWNALADTGLYRSSALKLVLLTGQRPGEVCHMRREHIELVEGGAWWHLPGAPDNNGWPGTKNKRDHRIWLSAPARAVLAELDDDGFVFGCRPLTGLDGAMRDLCARLGVDNKATPHDLRRTAGSTITALGFGRQAMDRILNHSDHSVGSIYDRHGYTTEDRNIMEAVGQRFMSLVEPAAGAAVLSFRKN